MTDYAERMERLRQIVQNAQNDEDAYWMIHRLATGILTHLNLQGTTAVNFLDDHVRRGLQIADLSGYEEHLHNELKSLGAFAYLPQRMTQRAGAWYRKLIPHVDFNLGGDVLDLGGGSGELALRLHEQFNNNKPTTVYVADALNWLKVKLPFLEVEGHKIDAKDDTFNHVIVLTVFHHTDDVPALVEEAFRVAKKRVVFIESVSEDLLMYQYGSWIDWFYNHVIHFNPDITKKINVPCHFMPATGWEQLVWRLTGLTPTVSKNLGIYQNLNPENHHIFVYDKQ